MKFRQTLFEDEYLNMTKKLLLKLNGQKTAKFSPSDWDWLYVKGCLDLWLKISTKYAWNV